MEKDERNMDQKEQKFAAPYTAPRVLEHTVVRFETMISSPIQCTPGFVEIEPGWVIWVDCVENY